jgi:hypothetical protein
LLTEVQVRVTDSDGSREQRVELARPAGALRVVHERECVPATTLGPDDLGGLWIVERIEGRWADLAGITLMRFTADGRFALDPEGQMFREGDQGVRGTYRLQGTRLHLQVDGGYACEKGYSEVWTTTLVEKDVLRLDVVRSDEGYCNSPAHEREVLRRLVPESRLPTAGSLRPG